MSVLRTKIRVVGRVSSEVCCRGLDLSRRVKNNKPREGANHLWSFYTDNIPHFTMQQPRQQLQLILVLLALKFYSNMVL